jgi:FAD/FMN-containing dehydrogenase
MTLGELESIVGSRYVSNSPLEIYANTLSFSPDQEVYVVRPGSTQEVSEVVKLANERGMRVIPRGMGTRSSASPFSHVVNGILMDMTRMRRVRRVDLGTMTVTVEAGITISKLNTTLAPRGLRVIEGTLCPFCATAGDTMGYGPGENKYGPRQEQIMDLEVVLPTGEVLQTGTAGMGSDHLARCLGPDLTGLFLEANGGLGVVTAVTYKMYRLPEAIDYANYAFEGTGGLVDFMLSLLREGIVHLPSLYEIYFWPAETFMQWEGLPHIRDQNPDFKAMFDGWGGNYPSDVIGIVFEGTETQVEYERKLTSQIADKCGSTGNVGPEPIRDHYIDRNWDGNTKAHEDVEGMATSWAEPIFRCRVDQYPAARELTLKVAEANGFRAGENYWRGSRLGQRTVSNYPCIMYDASDEDAVRRARSYYMTVLDEAVRMGCYRSVETQLTVEESGAVFDLLRRLKEMLDPNGVMVPLF